MVGLIHHWLHRNFLVLPLLALASGIYGHAQCTNCGVASVTLPPGRIPVFVDQQFFDGSASYLLVSTYANPAGYTIANDSSYAAWCVDQEATGINPAPSVSFYSTLSPSLPASFQSPAWPRVNYVLNHKGSATFTDVQRVIWTLLGRTFDPVTWPATPESAALLAAANSAAAAAYVPAPGEVLAVLGYQGDDIGGYQDFVIEVPVPVCGSLGNLVWEDKDKNGVQGSGEPGINNVMVTLTDLSGNAVRDVFGNLIAPQATSNFNGTQRDGSYLFSNLCLGAYKVAVGTVPNMTPTTIEAGSDRSIDSNGSPATATLTADAPADLSIDFGFYSSVTSDDCTGKVGNFVWYDADGDGYQDASEFGLPGVSVKIVWGGGQSSTTVTGPNGSYEFLGVCGTYTVSVSNPAKVQSGRPGLLASPTGGGYGDTTKDSNPNPYTGTLPSGGSDLTVDFGFRGVGGCTLTQGYWKTHSTVWPVSTLFLGGKAYTQAELLAILNTAVKGDASISLAYQLIAAKLNLYSGSAVPATVNTFIAQADALLALYPGKIPLKVGSDSKFVSLGTNLDTYNNGKVAGTFHCN